MEPIDELYSTLGTAALMLKSGNNIRDLERQIEPLFNHPLCWQACLHIISSNHQDTDRLNFFYLRFLTAKAFQRIIFNSWDRISTDMQVSVKLELLTAAFNPAIDYNSPDNKILYQCCGFALLHTESLENLNRDTSFLLLKIEENTENALRCSFVMEELIICFSSLNFIDPNRYSLSVQRYRKLTISLFSEFAECILSQVNEPSKDHSTSSEVLQQFILFEKSAQCLLNWCETTGEAVDDKVGGDNSSDSLSLLDIISSDSDHDILTLRTTIRSTFQKHGWNIVSPNSVSALTCTLLLPALFGALGNLSDFFPLESTMASSSIGLDKIRNIVHQCITNMISILFSLLNQNVDVTSSDISPLVKGVSRAKVDCCALALQTIISVVSCWEKLLGVTMPEFAQRISLWSNEPTEAFGKKFLSASYCNSWRRYVINTNVLWSAISVSQSCCTKGCKRDEVLGTASPLLYSFSDLIICISEKHSKLFFGEDDIFLHLRSGALGFSFSPDDGKSIWVGLLLSLLALPDKQVGVNVVGILGFFNDIAPKDFLKEIKMGGSEIQPHIFQDIILPNFDISIISLMRLQCTFPISSTMEALVRNKIRDNFVLSDEEDDNEIDKLNLTDILFLRREIPVIISRINKNRESGIINLLNDSGSIISDITNLVEIFLSLKESCELSISPLEGTPRTSSFSSSQIVSIICPQCSKSCRLASDILSLMRSIEYSLFLLFSIAENCFDDEAQDTVDELDDDKEQQSDAPSPAFNAIKKWLHIVTCATILLEKLLQFCESSPLRDILDSEITYSLFELQVGLSRIWQIVPAYLSPIYKIFSSDSFYIQECNRSVALAVDTFLSKLDLSSLRNIHGDNSHLRIQCNIRQMESALGALDAIFTKCFCYCDGSNTGSRKQIVHLSSPDWLFDIIDNCTSRPILPTIFQYLSQNSSAHIGDVTEAENYFAAKIQKLTKKYFSLIGKFIASTAPFCDYQPKISAYLKLILNGLVHTLREQMVSIRKFAWHSILLLPIEVCNLPDFDFSSKNISTHLKELSAPFCVPYCSMTLSTTTDSHHKILGDLKACSTILSMFRICCLAILGIQQGVSLNSIMFDEWTNIVSSGRLHEVIFSFSEELNNMSKLFRSCISFTATMIQIPDKSADLYTTQIGPSFKNRRNKFDGALNLMKCLIDDTFKSTDDMQSILSDYFDSTVRVGTVSRGNGDALRFQYESVDFLKGHIGRHCSDIEGINFVVFNSVNIALHSISPSSVVHKVHFDILGKSVFQLLIALVETVASIHSSAENSSIQAEATLKLCEAAALSFDCTSAFLSKNSENAEPTDFTDVILVVLRCFKQIITNIGIDFLFFQITPPASYMKYTNCIISDDAASYPAEICVVSSFLVFCSSSLRFENIFLQREGKFKFSKILQVLNATIKLLFSALGTWPLVQQRMFLDIWLSHAQGIIGQLLIRLLLLPQHSKTPNKFCCESLDICLRFVLHAFSTRDGPTTAQSIALFINRVCGDLCFAFPPHYLVSSTCDTLSGAIAEQYDRFVSAATSRSSGFSRSDICELIRNSIFRYVETASTISVQVVAERRGSGSRIKGLSISDVISDLIELIQHGGSVASSSANIVWNIDITVS